MSLNKGIKPKPKYLPQEATKNKTKQKKTTTWQTNQLFNDENNDDKNSLWKQNMEWFLNVFFKFWSLQFMKKKLDKSKFSCLALLFKYFFKTKIQSNMSKKRNDKESMICLTPK